MTIEQEVTAALARHIENAQTRLADLLNADPRNLDLLFIAVELRRAQDHLDRLTAPAQPAEKKVFFSRRGLERIAKHLGHEPTVQELDAVRSGAIRVP